MNVPMWEGLVSFICGWWWLILIIVVLIVAAALGAIALGMFGI
ncbi:MAG: hypothetical protein WCI88_01700 [Chloroflexota bacterium]